LNNNIAEEIKSRCNIVDVIGRYVALKREGSNHKGLCPFHNEKTPSFIVSEQKQIFNCFGCGEKGDVIEFIKKIENTDFMGAVKKLSEDYGIEIDNNVFAGESRKTEYYEINRTAARFFYDCFTKKANPGYDYMVGRGIDVLTLKRFGIGYADSEWNTLYKHLQQAGYSDDKLLELGIVSESKGRIYDKFRDRVMFPIINTGGKVIGFGGRVIGKGTPKYLNSNESLIFSKKNNLYGLNLARKDINTSDYVILVEGYMDVISLYGAGIKNVAASLGTALTENQGSMLKRYTDNVILAYDSDAAGQAAALRGLDILYRLGCKPKVLRLTDGKDPDEFIKKHGREAFLKLVSNALPYADYKIDVIKKKHDISTTQGNLDFLMEVKKVLKTLSPIEADIYIKKLSRENEISEGALRMEVGASESPGINTPRKVIGRDVSEIRSKRSERSNKLGSLERNLLKLMIVNNDYFPEIQYYEDVFVNPACHRIFEVMASLYARNGKYDLNQIADYVEDKDRTVLSEIMENIHFEGNEDRVFKDCIATIKNRILKKREAEILTLLTILNEENDGDKIDVLMRELMEIQVKLQK
jgi:DNA primase